MQEKEILFQSSEEGFENIMIFAKLRNNKFYYFSQFEENYEFEDIRDFLNYEFEFYQEDTEAKHNLAKQIFFRQAELIEKLNSAQSDKLRMIL